MRPRVYLETTIPSYLTAGPSRDMLRTVRQQFTRQWWDECRTGFGLVASQFVLDECAEGDPTFAAARLQVLQGVTLLDAVEGLAELAAGLGTALSLPVRAETDAVHIALAAVHRVDYLLTWNCRHIANAALKSRIDKYFRSRGLPTPTIATPEQLLGEESDVG